MIQDAVKRVYAETDPDSPAGHLFDNLTGICVTAKVVSDEYPGGICGTPRRVCHEATPADIGNYKPRRHFCCCGAMNAAEYDSIVRDRDRKAAEDKRAYDAIAAVVMG